MQLDLEDNDPETLRRRNKERDELEDTKRQLQEELRKPLLPMGISRKYITQPHMLATLTEAEAPSTKALDVVQKKQQQEGGKKARRFKHKFLAKNKPGQGGQHQKPKHFKK